MRRIAFSIFSVLALPALSTTAADLKFSITGGEHLTIKAQAEQQQWLIIGDKILIAAVVDGKLVVQQWTTPGPVPPDPGPNPPDPGPLPSKWQVAFVLESDDLDNLTTDQQKLLASILIRDELAGRGHRLLGVLDPDSASTASDAMKPWFESVKGKQLPVVAIAPLDGGTIYTFPLPKDVSALWAILEKPPIGDPKPPLLPSMQRRLPPVKLNPPILCPGGVCP